MDTERSSNISDQARCLLVRGDVDWTWDYTMLVTYDPPANMTYITIIGLTATEIDLVVSYLAKISACPSSNTTTHAALLPTILLDLAADETSSLLKLRIKMLSQIQQRTGMDRFNSLKRVTVAGEPRESVSEERKKLDLDAVMLRLTCLSDWVAAQRGFVAIQDRVVEAVKDMFNEEDGDKEALEVFWERLSFVKETLRAAEQKCQYLERSIGAQVQTVSSRVASALSLPIREDTDDLIDILPHRPERKSPQSLCHARQLPNRLRLTPHRDPHPSRQHRHAHHRRRHADLPPWDLRRDYLLHGALRLGKRGSHAGRQ
jgi:hypothetical protein